MCIAFDLLTFFLISAASSFLHFVLHFFKNSSCFFPIVIYTTVKGRSLKQTLLCNALLQEVKKQGFVSESEFVCIPYWLLCMFTVFIQGQQKTSPPKTTTTNQQCLQMTANALAT